MLTRSVHNAQIAAEQAAHQPAQQPANGSRVVRFASRDQFFSPPPDHDGDSEMADSDTETVHGGDCDTEMGDDSATNVRNTGEAPQTPTRSGAYTYGSVVLTPDKNKPRSSDRRQAVRDNNTKVHSRYPSLNGNSNHRKPVPYVLVTTTPRRGAGRPARNENTPGPSNRGPSTPPSRRMPPPASLQRRKMEMPSFDQLSSARLGPDWMMKNPVRWFRDANGQFVRDGSLPPEYFGAEQLREVQPPRADTPPSEASEYERCDTEPLEDSEDVAPVRPKRKTRAQARAEIDWSTVRRSVRIQERLNLK
ncbi:hypothetical protein GSI_10474 [Ganoderma sinense ZZ0214-1]|uniref:Uncharacterized protein n=1 Tax=Ganoderma sinense ZZ0214-1 TaxID=1077348 RepID=A0A2G8S0Q8_9APHY|nr:hypothetical protein GSI_10474 [Ganoderma sinense ZZ0214-1]